MIRPINPTDGSSGSATDDRPILAYLAGEEGEIDFGASGGPPATQYESPPAVLGNTSSPFVINITWDSSVDSAPAAFKTDVMAAVLFLESQFNDPVTININVGYGNIAGSPMSSGALGQSLTYLSSFTYTQIHNALVSDAKTADDSTAISTLPVSDPIAGSHAYWVATAEAKALNLVGASSNLDGYVGFSSTASFDYDNSNGVSPGSYDFYGVVMHELTEVMGRQMMDGETFVNNTAYEPLDLFHYSSAGVRDLIGTTAGYFSLDGGTTNLGNFNTIQGGDFGDWASSVGANSFLAFSNSGVVNPVTANDLREMDVLGWNKTTTLTPVHPSDFNHDGFDDVFFQNDQTGQLEFAAMNAGNFTGWGVALGNGNLTVGGHGDVNGDGYADIFVQSLTDNSVSVVLQHGNGSPTIQSIPTGLASDYKLVGVGDINHDGFADAVMQQSSTGNIYYANMANGAFNGLVKVTTSINSDWKVVGTGDVNGDGFTDVVLQSQSSGTVIYANMANGNFQNWGYVMSTPGWQVKAVGDLTGDGYADVVIQNTVSSQTAFANMHGGSFTQWGNATAGLNSDWVVKGVADVNGDSYMDVLVQQVSTGTTIFAAEGQNGFDHWGIVSTSLDTHWHLV